MTPSTNSFSSSGAGDWVPPTPEQLAPLLPDYEILSLLGAGGMGAVYHGIQLSLNRPVAIKLLPPELGQDPQFAERFRREAQAMAQLNHPNIVLIYNFGQTSECHFYFVMEYVEGVDLQEYVNQSALTHEGVLNAICQICVALEYAHEKGFVHRDIKPANVFVNGDGVLKVGDFGLAKIVSDEDGIDVAEKFSLTMTGVAMGTPHYIAPEQLNAIPGIDQRADIYSLGVIDMLVAGELPLLDYAKLRESPAQRPAGFDQQYPVYQKEVAKILARLETFDKMADQKGTERRNDFSSASIRFADRSRVELRRWARWIGRRRRFPERQGVEGF